MDGGSYIEHTTLSSATMVVESSSRGATEETPRHNTAILRCWFENHYAVVGDEVCDIEFAYTILFGRAREDGFEVQLCRIQVCKAAYFLFWD